MCAIAGAPAGYLRELPASLCGINLQWGLQHNRAELVKVLEMDDGRAELRAVKVGHEPRGARVGRVRQLRREGDAHRRAGDEVGLRRRERNRDRADGRRAGGRRAGGRRGRVHRWRRVREQRGRRAGAVREEKEDGVSPEETRTRLGLPGLRGRLSDRRSH